MMKTLILSALCIFIPVIPPSFSQVCDKTILAKGINFIETRTYSPEEDARILELCKDLRVADVSDGLDMAGLPGIGLVNPVINADWIDLKVFKHVFRGIALTKALEDPLIKQ